MESYDLTTGTFSGTSKRLFYFSIAAFIAGAAMLVAGSVMLGVGIHKYNQNVDAAAVVPATPSTTPPSNGGTGSTTTGSTTTGTAAAPTGTAAPPTGTEAPPTGTGGPPTGSEAPPTGSPGPAGAPDVLIMIDTSHEIGPTNFNQIIDYIATAIAPKLPLGGSASSFLDRAGDQTNVGIVGFSDASVNIMTYYEISDLASVQDALSHLTLSYSKTNPSKALTVMNKFGFTKVDNTNVMMVLASGTQADIDAAADALSQFQSAIQNFTFVALGKAGALNLSNFSNSDNVQIFMSENYVLTPEETNDLINGLNPTGATAVPVTVPPPPPGPTCNMDIAILIDQSVTVGTVDDFNRQIDYLAKSLVYSWNISYTAIETFGLLYSQFGTNLLSTKPFNYNATSEFIADLNKVKGKDPLGPNDIVGGLNSLQSHLTNRRPSFGLTTILITYSSEFDFNAAVAEVKNIGGNLIVVAVNTDPTNLYYLSGTVIETDKFFYDNNITSQINAALCAPPVSPSPLPTMPTSPTPSPTATVPPPTCNNDIAILIDQSVAVGNVTDFNKQINFLTNTLVNTWNVSPENIETLGLLYSQFGTYLLPTKPFGYNTTQQFVSDLNSVKGRDPMGYNDITAGLTSLQSHLTNLRPGRDLTTILITYNDDFFDVMSAIPVAEKISGKLIIVAVNTLAGNLYYLSGTVIQTDKDFNWDVAVQINTAICQSVIPPSPLPTSLPSPSPTTSTAATPSTPPPVDYIPCKSSIVFALDASNNNGDVEFAAMKRLVTNNIVAQNWTHFERVGLMSYADSSSCTYVYGTFGSKQNFDNTVNNNITKFASSNSITFGMGILMNTFIDLPLNYQNTIFFTSTSDPTDVAQAATNSVIIDYRGALIIVAIYPAKKQDLLPLVAGDASKIIEFNPFTTIDYDTYAAQILSKFDCGATTSTSPTPSTSISPTSSTITPQATTTTTGPPSTTATGPISSTVTTTTGPTSPTTTVTGQPPSTSTPAVPYIPCQSWIYFGVDDSNVLQDNQFMTQLNFISSAIGNITHPERIAANGMYSTPVPWNSGLTVSQIQSAVTQMFKGGPYSLGNQFSAILTNVQNTPLNSFSVGALIFISDTSTAALQGADQHFNQLTNVRITFVLLGTNVDASKLAKYSNNTISWPDLSQSQPTNWNNLYGPAYACTGGVSTLGTTTTTVTPPTSSSTSPTSISSSSVQPITSPTSTTQTSPASPQTTTTGTTPTVPYIPCQSWISFNVDDSNKLDLTSFAKQISFISSAIGNITHPERIAALSIYNDVVSWNNPLTISEIQKTVQRMQQLGDYRLRRHFAAIATALSDISNSNTQPIGSLVFISDTSVAALDGAEYYMDKMPNVKITFVLLGPDADQSKLTNFSSNFITWRDLSQPQPDNWNNLYGPAYGCSGPLSTLGPTSTTVTPPPSSSTVIPTSTSVSSPTSPQTSTIQSTSVTSPTSSTSGQTSPTSPQTTTTGTTPTVPFIPCQSWISFGIDDSNVLQNNDFMTQLNFISSAIGNITHPERIAAIGGYSQPVPWNSGLTVPQIQSAVTGIQQSGPYSLRMQFAAILTNVKNTPLNNIPVGALIFISDTSTVALQGADQLFNQLKNVTITFVLLGNSVDSSKLTQFSSNFIFWKDLSQPQPDNWNNLYGPAYGCGGISTVSPTSTGTTITPFSSTVTSTIISSSASSPSSTVPSTSTSLSSTVTSTTTSTITSTGGPTSPTSPTSPSDYIPCHSWISFNIDDSNILSTDNYNKQLNFVSAVIGDINHPERIQAIGAYDQPVFWNSPFSIADIQTAVKALPQEGAYRLRQQFAELLTGLESIQRNNAPVGALIFISDTSDAALQDASAVFSLLQNVRITFVLLGQNTDQNKLTNFSSNFINWKDLSQPLPDNWSNLYGTAYGCSEGISTVSPISTVTTVLPSSSSLTSTTSAVTVSSSISSTTQTVPSSSSVTTSSQTSITSTSGSTPSAGDYFPCQVLITTLVDISNALSIDQFQKQLTFTKNFITLINHPERIQYGAYYEGNGNMTYKWNDTNTQAGLLQAIDDTKQTSLPTSLAGAMRVLSNNAPQNRTIPDSTIIFVTDTTNSIQIQQAVNLYNSLLKARGVRLTFILAGNKTDANALRGFDDVIIFNWQNMNMSQPVGWDLSAGLRCTPLSTTTIGSTVTTSVTQSPSTIISTQASSSTITSQTTTSPSTQSTGIQSSTTPTSGYIPCQSWISFGIDDSNVLPNNNFVTQLTFISNAIGSINHPERIAAIGGYSLPVSWNSGLTISQIQTAVNGVSQSGPYSLKQQFAALVTNLQNTQTGTTPVGALIFVSDTTDAALGGADQFLPQLTNVRITFVLLGTNADASKLAKYSNNTISWPDLSQSQPTNWNNEAADAYGCTTSTASTVTPLTMSSPSSISPTRGGVTVATVQTVPPQTSSSASTSTSVPTSTSSLSSTSQPTTSTVSQTTGSTPSAGDYVPCQVLITTLVDISNALSIDQFQKQLTFTKNFITQINHPERIQYGAYYEGNGNMTYKWNDTNTQAGLLQAIDDTKQTSLPTSLAGAMRVLSNNAPQNRTIPDSTIIFVTDTTNSIQIQQAVNLYNSLLKARGVRLTFILAGNKTDANALRGFDDVIIFNWQNMNMSQPVGWDLSAGLRCTPLSTTTIGSTVTTSVTQSPSTIISTQASSSTITSQTTTSPSTQSTGIQSSTTPTSGYIPCQSWISFGIDDSNVLPNNNFVTQLTFISNAIGSINHPERIAAIGGYSLPVSWNSGLTISQIQTAVNGVSQSGPYSLKQQFAALVTNLQNTQTGTTPVGALIFVSDTTDAALGGADQFLPQLTNVRITFVLLGTNADASKLAKYSNNTISWPDLSQSQPTNWNNEAADAYGCTTSTASTVTPLTMSSPSSISPTRGGVTVATVQTVPPQTSSSASTSTSVPTSTSSLSSTSQPTTSTVSQTTGSTPSAGDYVPCQVLITTLVDISNALSIDQFQKQLTFTKNFITQINHPERIQYGAYYEGNGNMTYKWNDTNTQAGLLQAIDDTKQTSLPTSLAGAMRVLSNNAPQNRTIQDSTIIFVTDTTNSIQIQQAVNLYNSLLKARGVRLTFILAGNKTDATALSGFNDTIIFNWQNMNISQPVGWDLSAALRCTGLSSTTTGNTISVTSPTISTPGTATSVSPSTLTSLLSTSIQSSTTTSSGYIPCQSWISFGIDDSNVLQNNDFMTQLNFVSSAIGNITHTERIAAIGAYSQPVTWNSGLTISQIQQAVVGMFQAGPYSLKQQLAALLTNLQNTQTSNVPVGALIFISDTSDQALADVANTFGQLQNVRITFVLVGNNVDQTKLTQFSNNFISWGDLSKPQPDNWDAQAAAAYGCTTSTASTVTPMTMSSPSSVSPTRGGITVHTVQTVPPQTSSSTSSSTSATSVSSISTATGTAITTPEPYMPCQSWIGFLYDDSNVLSNPYFKTQMSFISTAIGSINYPDRLLIQGGFTDVASWNSHQTIPQLQAEINNIQQTHNTYLLKNQFANLATNVNTSTTTNWPVGALIFISDTSDAALVQANVYFANIPSNFLITFVLLGQNADSSKLTNFSSNFISWSDLSKPQPDSWNNSFYNAYGCNGVVTPQPSSTLSTASTSSTQSTTVTLPSTSSPSTASSLPTAVPPTQSTLIPYIPCQSWISFSYDDSSSLSVTDFETQTAFIANAINSMTYPDRIRANAAYTGVASWNSHQTILQMQNELNSSQPTSNTYSLLLEFAGLLTDTEAIGTTNWPIGALVFISDTSPTALDNANIYFSQLPPNVRLTFVLLGNKVDQTKLTQFSSNFIYWSDLSQPQPDNWDALSFAAYGCSAKYIL